MDSMYLVEDTLSENQVQCIQKDFCDSMLVLRFEKYIYSRVKSIVTDVTIWYTTVQLIVI